MTNYEKKLVELAKDIQKRIDDLPHMVGEQHQHILQAKISHLLGYIMALEIKQMTHQKKESYE